LWFFHVQTLAQFLEETLDAIPDSVLDAIPDSVLDAPISREISMEEAYFAHVDSLLPPKYTKLANGSYESPALVTVST
jgi:tRNA-dihydrouridine synthase A